MAAPEVRGRHSTLGPPTARALAAGADRDVADYRSEMRGQTRVLSALRETQAEQGADLQALRGEMTARFDQVNGGIAKIVQLLERLGD